MIKKEIITSAIRDIAVINPNKEIDMSKWDNYIKQKKSVSFCHLSGWEKVIRQSFGHRPFYLMAGGAEKVMGILPLFIIKSRLFGSGMVSVPFLDYGGICAENEKVERELFEQATKIACREKVDYIEFRYQAKKDNTIVDKSNKINLKLRLDNDPEVIWNKLEPKVRNQVRKAKKTELQFKVSGFKEVDLFYDVFARNMRDLGTPVYPKSFFLNILRIFPDNAEIFLIKYGRKVIGGALAFYFKNQMEIPWASCIREYFEYCPNNLLYWEAIKRGCERGCEYFNFGRSTKGSSHYNFKKQWGAQEQQLYYQYVLVNAKKFPDLNPQAKKYQTAVHIWKKLPVAVSNFVGPKISKYIP